WQVVAGVMVFIGVAMSAIPILNVFKYEFNNPPLCVWAGAVALTFIVAGIIHFATGQPRNRPVAGMSDLDNLRMLLPCVLRLAGLFTALFGLVLPFVHYRHLLSGGLEAWRKNADKLTWCLAAFMGGLVLMFIGLTMGRAYERTQAGLRRLMYGY